MFKNIISNIGDAYDNVTGIFTAPHNGTYQFMVFSLGTTGTQWAWITMNGERLSTSHGSGSWVQGSRLLPLSLREVFLLLLGYVNDNIWKRNGPGYC